MSVSYNNTSGYTISMDLVNHPVIDRHIVQMYSRLPIYLRDSLHAQAWGTFSTSCFMNIRALVDFQTANNLANKSIPSFSGSWRGDLRDAEDNLEWFHAEVAKQVFTNKYWFLLLPHLREPQLRGLVNGVSMEFRGVDSIVDNPYVEVSVEYVMTAFEEHPDLKRTEMYGPGNKTNMLFPKRFYYLNRFVTGDKNGSTPI